MNFVYLLYIIVLVALCIMNILLAMYSLIARPRLGRFWLPVFYSVIAWIIWCFFALSISQGNDDWGMFWAYARFLGLSCVGTVALCLVFEYTEYKSKYIRWLYLIPVVNIAIIFTNPLHNAFFNSWQVVHYDGISLDFREIGILFHVYNLTTIVLVAIAFFILLKEIKKQSINSQRQALWLILALVLTAIISAPSLIGLNLHPIPSLTPIGLGIIGIISGTSIFLGNIFNLAPSAYASMFNNIRAGILVLDTDYIIVDANHLFLLFSNKFPEELLYEDVRKVLPEFSQHVDLTRNSTTKELMIDQQQHKRYFDIQINPLYSRWGKVNGYVVTFYDITSFKESERTNRETISLLESYNDTVAHDLKLPLNNINLALDMAKEDMADAEKLSEHIEQAKNNLKLGSMMVSELLLFARVQNKMDIPVRSLNMDMLLDEAILAFMIPIQEQNINFDIVGKMPNALGYADWIKTVWLNYISNAIKYGGKTPNIKIHAEIKGDRVCYSVQDNGLGVAESEKPRLFNRFNRLDKHNHIEGTGLGLTIVKKIIERFDGEVGVDNVTATDVGPNEEVTGAIFWFTLKLAPLDDDVTRQ
jgi:signal transduction histidine kinase